MIDQLEIVTSLTPLNGVHFNIPNLNDYANQYFNDDGLDDNYITQFNLDSQYYDTDQLKSNLANLRSNEITFE